MRGILEKWHARLNGSEIFDSRRLEQRGHHAFIERMLPCFPKPNRVAMKTALLTMIEIHNQHRCEVEKFDWTQLENYPNGQGQDNQTDSRNVRLEMFSDVRE
jgi:hypothetical protein